MQRLTIAALIVGLTLAGALITSAGIDEIGEAFAQAGWSVALVTLARALVVVIAGLAWWGLFAREDRPSVQTCVNIRFIREAANSLLPVAQVGGDVIGARILILKGWEPALSAASVVTDLFLQIAMQFVFTLLGLGLLLRFETGGTIATTVATGLAIAAPALIGFYLVQRRGAGRFVLDLLKRLAGDRQWTAISATDAFYDRLSEIRDRPNALISSSFLHFLAWMAGSLEVYAALAFMGYPVGIAEAIIIESLMQAVRGAAFAVPGAIGVQEGGLIVLCGLFGVPPEQAIALSLVKRVADVLIGAPGLIAWQVIEGRRLLRGRAGSK